MEKSSINTELLEKNLKALPYKQSDLAAGLRALDLDEVASVIAQTRKGPCGIFFNGRWLTSRYDPVNEARREIDAMIEAHGGKAPKSLCVLGALGGHLINAAYEAGCRDVHVLEPQPEVLAAILTLWDYSGQLADESLTLSCDARDIYFTPEYRVRLEPDVAVCVSPAYPKAYPGLFEKMKERIQVLIRNADIISSTVLAKQTTWFDYAVDNFLNMLNATGIHYLFDRFANIPIVVVAAGPSLDKNVHHLKMYRDKVMVVTVGTALRKLEKYGIAPDLAVALESNDIMSQFENIGFLPDIFLALDIETYPKLWSLPNRGVFGYAGASKYTRWFMNLMGREKSNIPVGGSVATAAFSMALQMGGNPLILIGQDLAFSEGGAMHAAGIGTMGQEDLDEKLVKSGQDAVALSKSGVFFVDGYYGGKVMTKTNLHNYLLWYEQSAPILTGAGKRAINCTEGGAGIRGFEHLPLKEVLESLPPLPMDIKQEMQNSLRRDDVDTAIILKTVKDVVSKAKRLRHLSKKLRKSMADAVAAIQAHGITHPSVARANKLAEKTDREIIPLLDRIDHLLTPLCSAAIMLTEKAYDFDGLSAEQQIRMNMQQTFTLHDGFMKGADHLINKLTQLQEELESVET